MFLHICNPPTRDNPRGSALGRGESLALQTENLVVLLRIDPLHRAGIDAQHRGDRHEAAQCDVELPRTPFVHIKAITVPLDVGVHDLAILLERLARHAANLDDAVDVAIDVFRIDILADREDDQVRRFGHLPLVPACRDELLTGSHVVHDDEFPGLQTETGGGEHERLLEGFPIRFGDLSRRVELLGRVSPVQLL